MLSIAKIFVVIAAVLAMVSGVWVAAALLRTLIRRSAGPNQNSPTQSGL
ncbi:MAG: hypothetical protein ACYS8Z_11020 [Planctomycetota bacterium]|jgi:hypothetical protein